MKFTKTSMLATLAATALLAACSGIEKVDLGDAGDRTLAAGKADPSEFMLKLTDGSKAYISALAEFLRASDKHTVAEQLKEFIAGTSRPWDSETFEAASAKAEQAGVNSETTIKAPKDIAYAHVTAAFALSSYAGYLYKEALQDAGEIAKQPAGAPPDTVKAAGKAAELLPSFIKTAALIAEKTSEYMSAKGIAKPSTKRLKEIIMEHVGFVSTEVLDRIT